jgi:hypothetical protein
MYEPEDNFQEIKAEQDSQQQYEYEVQLRSEMFSIPKDKADLELKIKQISNAIIDGNINAIEAELSLKKFEELTKGVRAKVKDNFLTALDAYPEKTVKIFGAEITKRNTTTYDYTTCNDSVLDELQLEFDLAKSKLDERKEMLKYIQPMSVVNPSTGEFLQPPSKKVSESFAIKIL